jgi:hypothetical protein
MPAFSGRNFLAHIFCAEMPCLIDAALKEGEAGQESKQLWVWREKEEQGFLPSAIWSQCNLLIGYEEGATEKYLLHLNGFSLRPSDVL